MAYMQRPGEQQLLEMIDFSAARIVLTAVELELFPQLQPACTAIGLAAALELDTTALTRLLDALTGLGLLDKTEEEYAIVPELQTALGDGPGSILPMMRHRAHLWPRWSRLTEIVRRGTEAASQPETEGIDNNRLESFIGAMAVIGARSAAETAEALSLDSAAILLDIGGGPAVFAERFLQSSPGLRVVQLDHPEVCAIARRRLAGGEVNTRLQFVEGDALKVDPDLVLAASNGRGYDVVFMSNLIHSMSEAEVQALFRRCAGWVAPGGRIVVKDFLLDPSMTQPGPAAVFSINMLTGTAGGRSYSAEEVGGWLEQAVAGTGGQATIEHLPLTDGRSSLVIATIIHRQA